MKTNYSTKSNSEPASPDDLIELYKSSTGCESTSMRAITGSASRRRYYHIDGPEKRVGVIGSDLTENRAFLHIAEKLKLHGVNVPHITACSQNEMLYLQDDLGDESLYDVICQQGFSPATVDLCRKSINQLVMLQKAGDESVDFTKCFPVAEMSHESIMWDLNYFKYCFLKTVGIEIDEPRLEKEFNKLALVIETAHPRVFIHRDFQSRNILIHDNDTWIIDFQGGRRGPALYDIVSFLWQARAGFPENIKNELLDYYIATLRREYPETSAAELKSQLSHIVIFRTLQVLGAYGFRGLIEQKRRFYSYIPQAIDNLNQVLHKVPGCYPYIESLAVILAQQFRPDDTPKLRSNSPLTVKVYSFSYKKGIPADDSGNGGGFVFNCRAIHNPGRYEQYKQLTGDDLPVIEFLEYDGEITIFLDHCKSLVDASVERYIKRGFTNLMVSFGCTGGQHRSVYSATHMAEHLATKYGIHVILEHREQGKYKEFNK